MTAAPSIDEATEADQVEQETPAGPEILQPADVVDEETIEAAGKIEVFGAGFGALALDPRQKSLTTEQKLALVAIGIDTANDPQVEPHVRPFIHMCQSRGLDPWKREAYLIGRGEIGTKWRKFTMQVGIDGYRNMAQGTGRLSRVVERLWTGQEDDEAQWYRDDRGIMRRVWWDAWPDSKGYPGMAKVIVEHYDDQGRLTETEAEANWGMFAPQTPKYTGSRSQNNRRKMLDADGKEVMELGEMWQKGGGHMLSKCSEALAYRTAFPGSMAGTYLHEEMHQADAAERRRIDAERADQRRQVVVDLQSKRAEPKAAEGSTDPTSAPLSLGAILTKAQAKGAPAVKDAPAAAVADEDVVDAEVIDAEVVEEPAAEQDAELTDEKRQELLLAELDGMARLLGTSVAAMCRRQVVAAKKNVEDFAVDQLQKLVASLRPGVVAKLRSDPAQQVRADHYEQVTADAVGSIEWLFGDALDDVA